MAYGDYGTKSIRGVPVNYPNHRKRNCEMKYGAPQRTEIRSKPLGWTPGIPSPQRTLRGRLEYSPTPEALSQIGFYPITTTPQGL